LRLYHGRHCWRVAVFAFPRRGGYSGVLSRLFFLPSTTAGDKDLVQTAGASNNHGYVVPSKDLIFVRLGDGKKFPKGDFENELVMKVLAAVNP
jgi:hypothetical protein